MNGYEAMAKIMKIEGIEWMACYPSNPLIEATAKEGIRPILFRHERGGIMAADGFSRQSRNHKYGAFCSQGGPGVENSMGGIAQAWADCVPIIYFPDGADRYKATVKPTFRAPYNYQHIAKFAEALTAPGDIVYFARRAFHALKNGRPGPVVLEMPRDVMTGEVTNLSGYEPAKRMVSQPSAGEVKDAVTHLLKAKKPAIWAGQGVLYANAMDELREFAELTQIPIMTTMEGKSAIDEEHPLCLGAGNRTAPKPVFVWLKESDVLFAVGASLTITNYGLQVPDGKFIIHNTNNPDDVNKDYKVQIGLLGDSKATLRAMIEEVKAQIGPQGRKKDTSVQEAVAQVRKEWMAEWSARLNSDLEPILPYRLVNEINKNLDRKNSVVTHDAGHPRDEIMPFYTASVPGSYIGWGKTTHLGYGLPLMIGSKMANPNKFCLNFMGDGAFGMSGLDLETSVRAGLPITTVVLNNGTMGGYNKALPVAMEKYNVGNMTGDYAKIAEGLGAVGIKVSKVTEIGPALKKAQQLNKEGKTVLLDVKTQQQMDFSIYPLK
ncbi:MAG: thiamine pyrophosphate-requiring protein [Dehalococcoidia bacterium]|nr:thiamine pyrophosphate-requiring protein [Dehalococcoidia bacterium]MSQ34441.1 thiamine pyrophosphate-requiring protein [Dehalococcoidia bacterium]